MLTAQVAVLEEASLCPNIVCTCLIWKSGHGNLWHNHTKASGNEVQVTFSMDQNRTGTVQNTQHMLSKDIHLKSIR